MQPVETPFGRKTMIDQTTCNLDFSCMEGDCPSFVAITPEPESGIRGWLARRSGRRSLGATTTPTVLGDLVLPTLPDPEVVVPVDDFAMRITGIGGTGVVTVAQIIGTAAMLDGMEVRGLDQIGLSQKAGPVVSDIRLSRDRASFTNRLGEEQADLLLAFDQLVAASPKGLLTCHRDRTHVVGSNTTTPTGHMITHLDAKLPTTDELANTIGEHTRGGHFWVDAQAATTELFGAATTANIFVVGMAVQAGVLPVVPERIEAAIELNGVAVEANTSAFRWGRAQVAASEEVEAARTRGTSSEQVSPEVMTHRLDALGVSGDRRATLSMFATELIEWGDETTASDWFDVLDEVAAAEHAAPTSDGAVLDAVAAGLFKLTAYKDEYEVARLMTDPDAMAEALSVAGPQGAVAWKLHPPMMRALGYDKKISIGTWATPAIRQLAKRKHLRGTTMDPFGRAEVRKVERQLPGEYLAAVRASLTSLNQTNVDQVVALAELPDLVRGYEEIKLANVERFREALASATAELQ